MRDQPLSKSKEKGTMIISFFDRERRSNCGLKNCLVVVVVLGVQYFFY